MVLDEYGFLEEPCLSCDKARTDDLFYEWYCDEKECPYTAEGEWLISESEWWQDTYIFLSYIAVYER